MGVVQAVTGHVAKHTAQSFASTYPGGATPATLGAVCGYPGKRSSQLRAHVARNLQQGTVAQGITRYPPLSYAQWCQLLKLAERTVQAQPGSKPQVQAQAQAGKVWATARKGGKAASSGKRTAKQAAKAAPAATPTAQALAVADGTAPVPVHAIVAELTAHA